MTEGKKTPKNKPKQNQKKTPQNHQNKTNNRRTNQQTHTKKAIDMGKNILVIHNTRQLLPPYFLGWEEPLLCGRVPFPCPCQ